MRRRRATCRCAARAHSRTRACFRPARTVERTRLLLEEAVERDVGRVLNLPMEPSAQTRATACDVTQAQSTTSTARSMSPATRRCASSSPRSASIRRPSLPIDGSSRRPADPSATIAMECASSASVLRSWPVSKSRTRAASFAGTSTTRSPVASSRWASGRPAPFATLNSPHASRPRPPRSCASLRSRPCRCLKRPDPSRSKVVVDDLDGGRQLVGIDPDDHARHGASCHSSNR